MIECAYENKDRGRFNLLTASEKGVGVGKGEIDGLWTSVGANEVSFFYFLLKNFLRLRKK